MPFNSMAFFLFFLAIFSCYLALSHRGQNRLLLAASYLFYGMWDWRFLGLLILSSTMDFFFALRISRHEHEVHRKTWLAASIAMNLSILGFFKYFNFFSTSFHVLLGFLRIDFSVGVVDILLPVGISFYTFKSLSYTIDVYRRVMAPSMQWSDYALYVAFFPQLMAGPIERAPQLLPQIRNPRSVSHYGLVHGGYLFMWGLFQKVVIADNVSVIADKVFGSPAENGWLVLLGIYAFTIQIYGDFAGYSNMARGLAMMLGFRSMLNFDHPYLATNPTDFWRRWHISLSNWLRDYLYIPLGGNRVGRWLSYRNLMLTMCLGGLWHGASWTFVLWGGYHGLLLIVYRLVREWKEAVKKSRVGLVTRSRSSLIDRLIKTVNIVVFFHLTCLGWLIFRASSPAQVREMLLGLVARASMPDPVILAGLAMPLLIYSMPLLVMELWEYHARDPWVALKTSLPACSALLLAIFYGILVLARDDAQSFLYLQF